MLSSPRDFGFSFCLVLCIVSIDVLNIYKYFVCGFSLNDISVNIQHTLLHCAMYSVRSVQFWIGLKRELFSSVSFWKTHQSLVSASVTTVTRSNLLSPCVQKSRKCTKRQIWAFPMIVKGEVVRKTCKA